MATVKIEPAGDGKLWVTLTHFSDDDLARLKKIQGRRWNPERKKWLLPDTPEARAILAGIVGAPSRSFAMNVAPKRDAPPRQSRAKYIPGKSKPLMLRSAQHKLLNPPHPLIKQVDDELVLRGMAYGTRKSYGQHLRNYFEWLQQQHIEPERASREQIRGYLVEDEKSQAPCAAQDGILCGLARGRGRAIESERH